MTDAHRARRARASWPRLLGEPHTAEVEREAYGTVADLERERYGSVADVERELYGMARRASRRIARGMA